MAALLPNLGGLRLGPAGGAGGAEEEAEATAGFADEYELNPGTDAYGRDWDRHALKRVADPSESHEHWYEGHRGPKFGLTVATVRYFGAHAHSDEYTTEKVVGAELIVHGWHLMAGPPLSVGQANPALKWLMDMREVSSDADAADARRSARPDYYASYANDSVHRAPGCDVGGACVVPNYEHLDHLTHATLVNRLNAKDTPEKVRVKSMLVGNHAPVGYIMQLWVPESLLLKEQLFKTAANPVQLFEPVLYEALNEIFVNMEVSGPDDQAMYARGLFMDMRAPASTAERTAEYLNKKVGSRNFLVRRFGLATAEVRDYKPSAEVLNVPTFAALEMEKWIPIKFVRPNGEPYYEGVSDIIGRFGWPP